MSAVLGIDIGAQDSAPPKSLGALPVLVLCVDQKGNSGESVQASVAALLLAPAAADVFSQLCRPCCRRQKCSAAL